MPAWQEIKNIHKTTTLGAKEGVAFRYFSRPLASLTLYGIRNTKITPNQVTILSLVVGLAGFTVHMLRLDYAGLLIGCALFMLAHMLDALDGQLARYKKAGSEVGMHFDFFIDEVKAYLLYVAIIIRLYRQLAVGDGGPLLDRMVEPLGSHGLLIVGLIGMTGLSVGISCTQFLKLDSWKKAFPPAAGAPGASKSPVAALIGLVEKVGHFIVDYPSYIVPLCLFNAIEIYVAAYTLVVCAYAARSLLSIAVRLWRVNPYAS